MNQPSRLFLFVALLAPAIAAAQTTTTTTTTTVIGVPVSLQVSRLAPQLINFAGGQVNFDSLVNGLALGTPVTLSTTLPNGQVQVTTFTPPATLTPIQIAQTLETARQSLISRGIATPSGQQLAISLTGGSLPTQTGNVQVSGLLPTTTTTQPGQAAAGATGTLVTDPAPTTTPVTTTTTPAANPNGTPSPAALLQGQSPAGGPTPPSPAAIIQSRPDGNISNTPTTGNVSNTPSVATPAGTTAPPSTAAPAATTPARPLGSVAR
jgi:hypothetical protein